MDNRLIKNPARQKTAEQKEKYEPEYKKLGREPVVMNTADMKMVAPRRGARPVIQAHSQYPAQNLGANRQPEVTRPPSFVNIGNNEDWQDPNEEVFEVSEDEPNQSVEELADLTPGNYYVFAKGEIVFSSESSEAAREFIDNVLLYDQESDLNIEDIVLLKRLAVRVGVLPLE